MSITWLVPAAIWGLAALAVPILVHLLTRQERRAIVFPSLRFLQTTRLAATRQRRIRDWLLLAVRAATIAAAVAALAGPLLLTAARDRAWNARTARAIVTLDNVQVPTDEAKSAFAFHTFAAKARASTAVRSAGEWLATEPPAARELVIVGDLREGAIDDADVTSVPKHVGIRFVPLTDMAQTNDVTLPVLTLANGSAVVEERRVQLNARDTVVEGSLNRSPMSSRRMEMRAAPEDQRAAEAALTALFDEGVVADAPAARQVIVVWPGGTAPQTTGDEVRVVRVTERPTGVMAVQILREIAADALDDPASPQEPRRVSATDLARWSRPAGPSPPDAVKQDEGDRRVLWVGALALLLVEWLLRRAHHGRPATAETPTEPELADRGGSHREPRSYAAWSGRFATRRGEGGRVA